jgi:DNA-binding transcriptional MerR regulator
MFTIKQLVIRSKLPDHDIRNYAPISLIDPSLLLDNGCRLFFNPIDAARLQFIRLARQPKFTLNNIKGIIQHDNFTGMSSC